MEKEPQTKPCLESCVDNCVTNMQSVDDGLSKLRQDLLHILHEGDPCIASKRHFTLEEIVEQLKEKQKATKSSLYRMATGSYPDETDIDDFTTKELIKRVDDGIKKTTSELYDLRNCVKPDLTERPIVEYLGPEQMPSKIGEIKDILNNEKGRIDQLTEKKVYVQPPSYTDSLSKYVDTLGKNIDKAYNAGRRGRCFSKRFQKLTENEHASVADLRLMLKVYRRCDECHCDTFKKIRRVVVRPIRK